MTMLSWKMSFAVLAALFAFAAFSFDGAHGEQDIKLVQGKDIIKLMGEEHPIHVGNQTFLVYYGFADSFEIEIEDMGRDLPGVSAIRLNEERKSLEIDFENTQNTEFFWIRMPKELIMAEPQFHVFIDGQGTKYDVVVYEDGGTRVGFILPSGSRQAEVVGTHVVPEFGYIVSLILALSIVPILLLSKIRSTPSGRS